VILWTVKLSGLSCRLECLVPAEWVSGSPSVHY